MKCIASLLLLSTLAVIAAGRTRLVIRIISADTTKVTLANLFPEAININILLKAGGGTPGVAAVDFQTKDQAIMAELKYNLLVANGVILLQDDKD